MTMRARELMTRDVTTCRPEDTCQQTARIMRDEDCGIVPVVDADEKLKGVITDRDVTIAAHDTGKGLGEIKVEKIASRELTTVNEDADIDAVHEAMRERKVRRLPVVNGERELQGIVSLGDLSRAVAEKDGDDARVQQREVARTLARISEPTPRPRA